MVSFSKTLLFYLAGVNLAASAATIVTYIMVSNYGLKAEYNPIMRLVFRQVGLVTGLFLRHVYLTVIGLVIFCIAVKYRFEALIWIYALMIVLDSIICIVSLLKLISEIFI